MMYESMIGTGSPERLSVRMEKPKPTAACTLCVVAYTWAARMSVKSSRAMRSVSFS